MNFPADLLYTSSHEWAKIEGDVLTMGLTDYAQSELGDIVFVKRVKKQMQENKSVPLKRLKRSAISTPH